MNQPRAALYPPFRNSTEWFYPDTFPAFHPQNCKHATLVVVEYLANLLYHLSEDEGIRLRFPQVNEAKATAIKKPLVTEL